MRVRSGFRVTSITATKILFRQFAGNKIELQNKILVQGGRFVGF